VAGHDACRVLAAMLQHGKRIVQRQINIGFADHSNYATHKITSKKQSEH
jgi:hypothetical protein